MACIVRDIYALYSLQTGSDLFAGERALLAARLEKMRILIINTDYPKFLNTLYARDPHLSSRSYAAQLETRNDSLFGVADFYSQNFRTLGHDAVEIHVNNHWLQYAWAREHGLSISPPPPAVGNSIARKIFRSMRGRAQNYVRAFANRVGATGISAWERSVLSAQIEDYSPDVILNQDIYYVRSDFWALAKGRAKLVGQNAAILPSGEDYTPYDLLVSSLPNYVKIFAESGKPAILNRLAFEPSVLPKLGTQPERDIPLSFAGSLSPDHVDRIAFLEHIAAHAPLKVWGNGIERLPARSRLHSCYQGEVWGRDMYNVLRRSKITLNKHINIAGNMANNMRLYEATGMGALLLTDNQVNLREIFTPEEQVETYDTAEDCIVKIEALLADEPRRAAIAAAGQKQAIEVQNYYNRCREQVTLFEGLM